MTKYIISTQAKEWYGCENNIGDPTHGRYKMKGGQAFIFFVEAEESLVYDEEKILASFNEKYDKVGCYWRYEAKRIDWYDEPAVAKIVNEELLDRVKDLESKLEKESQINKYLMKRIIDVWPENWEKIGNTKGEPEFFNSPKLNAVITDIKTNRLLSEIMSDLTNI